MDANEKNVIQLKQELQNDTAVLSEQANAFIETVSPYLMVDSANIENYLDKETNDIIETMSFFKLNSCTTEDIEDLAEYLSEKMEKLFKAIHSMNTPIVYGIISYEGEVNLVIGIQGKLGSNVVKPVLEGLLTGIELTSYTPDFRKRTKHANEGGIISAVPVLKIDDERQKFDISTLMRSLNGQNYTVLFVAQPYLLEATQDMYGKVLDVRDKCFAVSKKNIARASSKTITTGSSENKTSSHTFSAIVYSYNRSTSVTTNMSEAIGDSETTSSDIQNGIALEMMEYCDKAIERLKQGQTTGLWGTTITYSTDNEITANILKSCLCGELSKSSTDILPLRRFTYKLSGKQDIYIPLLGKINPLYAPITSAELGMICTPPFESVPDFELKKGKIYPMVASSNSGVIIGKVSDGYRPLEKMNFSLSENDLNKHTFICGITGSGKTTTVKGILDSCKKPFMVIESAKKEYRNIHFSDSNREIEVYTLGKPEINCLQFNPFYIQCGINLQTHIDFLKDLFNASFSFYGPMPYILERCLHNIYKQKGWNLTLGYHPYLVNTEKNIGFFDSDYMKKQYAIKSHKYLFPTMQDLKDEVKRYIEQEMQYDGEVGGNIKTAILARLESLCVGSKGFMLNSNEPIPMEKLMQQNVVFELEGLADDSDKAFCVGLLVIFINEYRQIFKEKKSHEKLGLQHLLVIEEAHRLLKNVETERGSENMGNPKGKAVEHFTNMIAEMRSYGQGVIIAEQIPSKLAPDVIKNSSNKIIQRVVSADDQALVANTIGMKEDDAVLLGGLKTGCALCHKEGMSLPVYVNINNISDDFISDGDLFNRRQGAMFEVINYSIVKENTESILNTFSLKVLNSILAEEQEKVVETVRLCKEKMAKELIKRDVALILGRNEDKIYGKILSEKLMQYLVNGVYSIKQLPNEELYMTMNELCEKQRAEDVIKLKNILKEAYKQNCRNRCILIISELIKKQLTKATSVKATIQQYFFNADIDLVEDIETAIKEVS